MKLELGERLLHYVSFIGERCGSMREQQMLSVKHVFILHQGMHFISTFHGWFVYDLLELKKVSFVYESVRIMIAALSFLLDYEKIEDDDDSDANSDEDDLTTHNPQVILSKEAVYKVSSCPQCFKSLLYSHYEYQSYILIIISV